MSLKKYKTIDITIFTVIICLVEIVNTFVIKYIFKSEYYALSLVITLTLIVVVRWGIYGIIPAVIASTFSVIINKGSGLHYFIYLVSCLGFMIPYLFLKIVGHRKVEDSLYLTILYCLIGFISVDLLRSIFAITINGNIAQNFIQFFAFDMFNLIIGLIVIIIARKQNGIFEDQISYLKRIQAERKKINSDSV